MSTYNNHSLFSDYYLEELVGGDAHWQALKRKAREHRQRIANILDKAAPGVNGDTPEAEVERRLIRPILDSLEHVYFVQPAVPSSEGVRRPDYAFFPSPEAQQEAESHKGQLDFFKAALAVGDAKAWQRSLDKRVRGPGDPFSNHNPSYQIDFYLRATDRRWGLLTNGRHWRLYHRDVSYRLDVYYEVDLPQIVTLDEDAFLYFLAFFHKEAFQPDGTGECFLDRAYRASTEYAAKVSEELKDNVYEALRLLAEGFLSFPGNGLKPEDLDLVRENAFIVIYRLLFILYAEAREFLPVSNPTYWGTYSLRALAHEVATKEPFEANLHPAATGYWSRLQEAFRLINSGDDFLRIPPYNGRLFDDQKEHQRLAAWKIGDRYLAGAVDQLARARAAGRTGRGFVSYRDLSIRELGSIYEGLLEHRPRYATQDVAVVKEDKREKFIPITELGNHKALRTYRIGSVYLETDNGERKSTGSYYTPDYIVKYIVGNALGPLLEEAKKSSGNLIDVILSLKVLDPAMGSGHFLVEAIDYLAGALVEALGGDPREMEEDEIRWARREVVERCIYGVDLNPLAVDLAKLSLWLSTVSLDKPLNFLDHHLRFGNSLIGARLQDLGQLSVLGKKASKAAPATQSLLEYWFHQNVATAVDNYFRIAAISSDKLQQIQEKEKLYGVARDILKRYRQVAHIWTSSYFGNEVPAEGYMSLQDKIRAPGPEWVELEKQLWFARGIQTGEGRRFFHWELEFPEVFFDRNGQRLHNPGFSAVVGNPPYILEARDNAELFRELKRHPLLAAYYEKNIDIFCFFADIALDLLVGGGAHSFIVPIYWTDRTGCSRMRQKVFDESTLELLVDFDDFPVFEDAPGHHSSIYKLTKSAARSLPQRYLEIEVDSAVPREIQQAAVMVQLQTEGAAPVSFRLSEGKLLVTPLGQVDLVDVFERLPHFHLEKRSIMRGVDTSPSDYQGQGVFVLSDSEFKDFLPSLNVQEREFLKPFYSAAQIDAYYFEPQNAQWLIYTDRDRRQRLEARPREYPHLVAHLMKWAEIITSDNKPYGLHRAKEEQGFLDKNKLLFVRKTPYPKFAYCRAPFFCDESTYIVLPRPDRHSQFYLLSIFDSAIFHWWCAKHKTHGSQLQIDKEIILGMPLRRINFTTAEGDRERLVEEGKKLYRQYIQSKDWSKVLSFMDQRLPQKPDGSPDTEREQSDVVHDLLAFLAEEMTELHKEKQAEIKGFLTWLEGYLGVSVEDLKNKTKVKEYWKGDVGWEGFLSALEQNRRAIQSAKGVDVTRREPQETIRAEFGASVARLRPLLESIELTDRLIDQTVYKLYGLTEDEIAIVGGKFGV